jgi:essential nuclear protein 1
MAKDKKRKANPVPFLPDENGSVSASTKRAKSKAPKHHQEQQKTISSGISSKILKEALAQQREVEDEDRDQNPNALVFPQKEAKHAEEAEEDDVSDDFDKNFEPQSEIDGFTEGINEEDENVLEAFRPKNSGPQLTLADIIIKRMKEADATLSSEARPMPKIDNEVIELYKKLGTFLSRYTIGKFPDAFRRIPSLPIREERSSGKKLLLEEALYLTEPEKWTPTSMYQATRMFASRSTRVAQLFFKLVLLPRVREDIRKNRSLHFHLFESLKKALFKPAAFNKAILFPLCQSGTCTLREAVIVGSVLQKVSVPVLHSSAALMMLANMEYCGTTSYFIKILIEKKYSLPFRVVDALVEHFLKFLDDTRVMPVIWHQSLLAFVQRFKNATLKEDKDDLIMLLEKQYHYLVTPEILRELDNSRNRGDKEDEDTSISSALFVIKKVTDEDRDIPEVPMEED